MCESIDELTRLRDHVREEVKTMARIDQQWLLDEWTSAKWRFDNPGISDKDFAKIMKKVRKDEAKCGNKKSQAGSGSYRGGHRKTGFKYADNYYGWQDKK